jgi:hypothetical protein
MPGRTASSRNPRRLGRPSAARTATLLIAAGFSPVAQSASAASRLSLAPKVIVAPVPGAAPGTEMTVRAGQTVLRAPLGWLSAARLDAPVTVEAGGRSARLPANALLIGAIASGGDLRTVAGGAVIFCSGDRAEAELGIAPSSWSGSGAKGGGGGSDRLCLIDSDRDARFDLALLPGAKRPEDKQAIALEPVAYKALTGAPMAGESEVRIVYQSGTTFRVEVVEGGKPQKFGLFSVRLGPSTIFQTDRVFRVQSKRLPQRQLVGSAAFTILSIDEAAGVARIAVERDFYLAPYSLGSRAQTIHIYVP